MEQKDAYLRIADDIRRDIEVDTPSFIPQDPSLYGFFESGDNYSDVEGDKWIEDPDTNMKEAERRAHVTLQQNKAKELRQKIGKKKKKKHKKKRRGYDPDRATRQLYKMQDTTSKHKTLKKIKKLKKSKYNKLDIEERQSMESGFSSSYDDSDSKFEEFLDDDKAMIKLTQKLIASRDELNINYSSYKRCDYDENELAPSMKRHKKYNFGDKNAQY